MKHFLTTFLLLSFSSSAVAQSTYYVPDDFATIQLGIAGSSNGDTVIVRDGTYDESITLDQSKHIILKSENGPANCSIVDSMGNIVVNFIDLGTTSVIDGFTIGWTSNTGIDVSHGGSPTILNCIIEECDDNGIDISGSPTIENCIIRNCSAGGIYGGGIEIHSSWPDAVITNCTIENCSAQYGGGILVHGNTKAIITDCAIKDCSATYDGGGMYADVGAYNLTLDNCTFSGNTADRNGGGMGYTGNSPILINCMFTNNSAVNEGGGMWCNNNSSPTLENCTFTYNSAGNNGEGGAIFFDDSSPTLEGCVFYGNEGKWGGALRFNNTEAVLLSCTITNNSAHSDGGGIHYAYNSNLELNNCIVWGNSASHGANILADANSANTEEVTYSCVGGGFSGIGNIDDDPLFVDALNGDYSLSINSPCKDTGDPNSPLDPDGTRADIGTFFFDQSIPMLMVSDLVANQTADVLIYRCTPLRPVLVMYSFAGGGPTSTPWGMLSLTAPYHFFNPAIASAAGVAQLRKWVPNRFSGMNVWMQAIDWDSRAMSNGLALTVQ
jgi:hypothetical protein